MTSIFYGWLIEYTQLMKWLSFIIVTFPLLELLCPREIIVLGVVRYMGLPHVSSRAGRSFIYLVALHVADLGRHLQSHQSSAASLFVLLFFESEPCHSSSSRNYNWKWKMVCDGKLFRYFVCWNQFVISCCPFSNFRYRSKF